MDDKVKANFSIKLSLPNYNRLRNVSAARGKTMTQLIEELIDKHLKEENHDVLIKQFMSIPAAERMRLMLKIKQQEEDEASEVTCNEDK